MGNNPPEKCRRHPLPSWRILSWLACVFLIFLNWPLRWPTHTSGNNRHSTGDISKLKSNCFFPQQRACRVYWDPDGPNCVRHRLRGRLFFPLDPGDYPRLPAGATACQKEEALACHKRKLLEYRKYSAIVVCCCNRLQKAIHEDNLAELEDARLGLPKKSPKYIFDHVIA